MRREGGKSVNTTEVDWNSSITNEPLYPFYLYTNKAKKATNKTIKHPYGCPNGKCKCFCGDIKRSGKYRRHQLKQDLQQEIKINDF